MRQKHAQPMSPRTQSFMQGMPSGDEETHLFEEGFTQMAYNVLVSKFPDLLPQVVTFKILDTDIEGGSGAGCFVIQHGDDVFYIPVILADNQIKPLDIFYHKGLNVFLPLNNDWLEEVNQLTLDEMGEAVRSPRSLRRNVDMRPIMVPPTYGRYAYAAAKGPLTDATIADDLYNMCWHLQKEAHETSSKALLHFLAAAPENIKEAFHRVVQKRPRLQGKVAMLYGVEPLAQALAPTKTASAASSHGGALFVADRDTPASEFKKIFGDQAPTAYQGVLLRGYAFKDTRPNLKHAVQIQGQEKLETPTFSGFYRVFTTNGGVKEAFILHNPRAVTRSEHETPEGRHGKRWNTLHFGQHNKDFIVVMKDGNWIQTSHIIAEPLERASDAPSALFGPLAANGTDPQPKVGDRGLFVVRTGAGFIGTEPFRIKAISTRDNVKRITLDDFNQTVLVLDPKASRMGLHRPKGVDLLYVPTHSHYIRLKDDSDYETKFMRNPTQVARWFRDRFEALGATAASVKNAGAQMYSIDGTSPVWGMGAAIKEAAQKHHIHALEAERLVKEAAHTSNGHVRAYILTSEMLTKMAQVPMMGDPTGAAPPPDAPPADPSMAPPPPPPTPSPLDIAMGEAHTQIQQQTMDLQTQQAALQDKAQTLMMVQQRAQEIATGGAAAVQQGAPPMMPGAPGAAPPDASGMMPPQGPMPQDPMPQGPMPQGPMPGPAPEMAGPAMGGDMGGAPPSAGAMMPTESPSAMEIQQQVNPQFLEQAANMEDTGVFDAAAIASMAQAPSFRDMVVDYVPTLERALDNLARVLLSMWMQEAELKKKIGDEDFSDLEDNTRAVFEGLGKLILQINRNAIVIQDTQGAPA